MQCISVVLEGQWGKLFSGKPPLNLNHPSPVTTTDLGHHRLEQDLSGLKEIILGSPLNASRFASAQHWFGVERHELCV